jgi:hypothetical protein
VPNWRADYVPSPAFRRHVADIGNSRNGQCRIRDIETDGHRAQDLFEDQIFGILRIGHFVVDQAEFPGEIIASSRLDGTLVANDFLDVVELLEQGGIDVTQARLARVVLQEQAHDMLDTGRSYRP